MDYITPETLKELYVTQDMTLTECAIVLKVSRSKVTKLVKEYNLKKSNGKFNISKEQLYQEYIENNRSLKECTKIFKVDEKVLRRRLRAFGIEKSKELLKQVRSRTTKEAIKDSPYFKNSKNAKYLQKWKEENPELYKQTLRNQGYKSIDRLLQWCKDNSKKYQENLQKTGQKLNKWKQEHPKEYQQLLKQNSNGELLNKWKQEHPKEFKSIYMQNLGVIREQQLEELKNIEDLNETFVRETFIIDGKFKSKEFMEYFNFASSSSVSQYKKLWNIIEPTEIKRSRQQLEINSFINDLGIPTIFNDRRILHPLELDIYIPDFKLGIEFDGLLYHSFGKSEYTIFNNYLKESTYKPTHKLELCKEKGIHLLTIWENEWINKQEIWKSVISSHLGHNQRIYARKCSLREVSSTEAKKFLQGNHLQGAVASSINLGLYHEDNLVSLMTFGKSRFSDKYQYELLRYCNKLYTNVIGGASRLLSYFIKAYKPVSIISYANRRWSNGNLYDKLGFECKGTSKPVYYYLYKQEVDKVYSRLTFQKYKLKDILENFDESLSEKDNMYNNDYRRVYDCGQFIYTWRAS